MLAIDVARLDTPPIRSYATGIPQLDALIGGGVSTRQLLAVLGPPGAGKSAWAVATAIRVAPTLPVLYASTELERHELMSRVAGNLIDRPWSAIARGDVPRDWLLEALAGVRIRLLGCDALPRDGSKALELIEHEARALAKEHGVPPLVIVDYLQDLARGAERDVRGRIGDIATELRAIAQRLDCPVIAVSSVARAFYSPRKAAEMREADDPTVYLAAAKESGDVDYAAAVVVFLDVVDADQPERPARIAVAKSRHGSVGFAGARFAGPSGRWTPAPEIVAEMAAPGRSESRATVKLGDADTAVLQTVERLHREGRSGLCTRTQVREECGIRAPRVSPAIERLIHAGTLREVEVERSEGGRSRKRMVLEAVAPAAAVLAQPQLDLDARRADLHGATS